MAETLRLSYYPWITQHVSQTELRQQVERFAAVLSLSYANLGGAMYSGVTVLNPLDVYAQVNQIVSGDAELALMNPLGYMFARQRSSFAVKSIVVALRAIDGVIGDTYYAQVYARRDAGIADLASGRGKSIGFGVPYSTSNFLIPAHELRLAGLHPLTAFSSVNFLGGHDKVAIAVYEGCIQLGAGHDGVITDLARQPGYADAQDVLVRLHKSAPIKSDPIAVLIRNANERGLVQRALIVASQTTEGRDALARFWGQVKGLAAVTEDAYDNLMAAANGLALTESEILEPQSA
jgi:ABC-type phosphate/phosphonate transport system substrate-binding protein